MGIPRGVPAFKVSIFIFIYLTSIKERQGQAGNRETGGGEKVWIIVRFWEGREGRESIWLKFGSEKPYKKERSKEGGKGELSNENTYPPSPPDW